ncbi:MAG: hypothetical protein KDA37_15515, partial [Planctomycetales bacterium]|nr:hypothetical protein [Planctomycetales bacterium]
MSCATWKSPCSLLSAAGSALSTLAAIGLLLGAPQTACAVLTITNGDFEAAFTANTSTSGAYSNENAGGVTETITDWFSVMDLEPDNALDPWWGSASYFEVVNPFPDQSIILGDLYSTGNGVGDRWIYQPIGTWDGVTSYDFSLDYGQPTDGSANRTVGVKVEVYQGAFGGAADNV